MKTTRLKLVEFLRTTSKDLNQSVWNVSHSIVDEILLPLADKLIESGLVEIEEEPKEWWLIQSPNNEGVLAFENLDKCRMKLASFTQDYLRLSRCFNVHSVDQCKKYETMWEKLKSNILEEVEKESQFPCGLKATEIYRSMQELEKGAK